MLRPYIHPSRVIAYLRLQVECVISWRSLKIAFTLLFKVFATCWPFTLPSTLYTLGSWSYNRLSSIHFFAHLKPLSILKTQNAYRTYSPQEEITYWTSSARAHRAFSASNGTSIPSRVPLPQYYTPKILPAYRSMSLLDPEADEYYLPPKAFCKWHYMVFEGPVRILNQHCYAVVLLIS